LEFSPETAHVSIYTAFLGRLGTLPVFALKAKTADSLAGKGLDGFAVSVRRWVICANEEVSQIAAFSQGPRTDPRCRYPGRHFSV